MASIPEEDESERLKNQINIVGSSLLEKRDNSNESNQNTNIILEVEPWRSRRQKSRKNSVVNEEIRSKSRNKEVAHT